MPKYVHIKYNLSSTYSRYHDSLIKTVKTIMLHRERQPQKENHPANPPPENLQAMGTPEQSKQDSSRSRQSQRALTPCIKRTELWGK